MMDNPLFVIEKGRGRYRLRPVSGAGWLAFLLFMTLLLTPILLLTFLTAQSGHSPLWTIAWLPWFGLLFWLFMRWARGRAKVIDLDQIEADYDDYLAWKKRGKR